MPIQLVSYFEQEPRQTIQCKFVNIRDTNSGQFVVLGAYEEFPFHAHLVAKFCRERDILVQSRQGGEMYEIIDPRYEVSGGGWIEINPVKKRIFCYGASKAYGRFSIDIMQHLPVSGTIWQGYQIIIES